MERENEPENVAASLNLENQTQDLNAIVDAISKTLKRKLQEKPQTARVDLGVAPVPHVATFQGFANTLAKTYWTTDEAIKQSWENARYMKNDLAVMECVEMRRRSVALLEWRIVPDDPNNKELADAAAIVERIIKRTPRFLQLRENLLYALWYGKYGAQLQWGRAQVDGAPRFYVQNWIPVNGDKIVYKTLQGAPFETDRVGIRIGYAQGALEEEYPGQIGPTDRGLAYFLTDEQRDRFIVHRHMVEDGDYDDPYSGGSIYGVGIRSRIYWTWYLMKETLAWLMEYIERSATGFEIWYYPAGNEKARDAIKQAAEDRVGHSGNIVLVPQMEGQSGPSYQMQRIEPSMSGAEVCISVVKEFFQHQIKRYILGQTLTTESGATGLGSNVATIHLETYLQIIKYDALNLEETLSNELVDRVRKFNFPWLEENSLRFHIETDEIDHSDRLMSIRTLYDMGAPISQEQALSAAGLTAPKDDEAVLFNPQIESAKTQLRNGGDRAAPGMGAGDGAGPGLGEQPQGAPPLASLAGQEAGGDGAAPGMGEQTQGAPPFASLTGQEGAGESDGNDSGGDLLAALGAALDAPEKPDASALKPQKTEPI